jgi:hypothetical protein
VEFVISSRFSFEIRFDQKILQICLRQLWWKLDSTLISVFVTLQNSLPYSRTDFTLLLYNLIIPHLLPLNHTIYNERYIHMYFNIFTRNKRKENQLIKAFSFLKIYLVFQSLKGTI